MKDGGSLPSGRTTIRVVQPELIKMKQEIEFEENCRMDDVPVSAVLTVQRRNKYGSVPGLDDNELADPDELERQVMLDEFGPVWIVPVKGGRSEVKPGWDEDSGINWGAFGTVDFDRYRGHFDRAIYKADKLKEELKDLVIRIAIVKARLPGRAKYVVLKYLRMGVIEMGHIVNADMLILARLYMRARRLRQEIWQLEEAGRARMIRRLERFWGD